VNRRKNRKGLRRRGWGDSWQRMKKATGISDISLFTIQVGMSSRHIIHAPHYAVVDVIIVNNGSLYIMLARCFSYFRVWEEGTDLWFNSCAGFEFLWVNIVVGPSKKLCKQGWSVARKFIVMHDSEVNVRILLHGEECFFFF
jgi:hypothetical protein